jgi:predicted metalloendopeptidase
MGKLLNRQCLLQSDPERNRVSSGVCSRRLRSEADDAVNYGGMGAAIDEITMVVTRFSVDGKGNLRDWWSKDDRRISTNVPVGVQQFDSYEVEPGLHENGKLVLGESIANLGGLAISVGL